jgi:hypothetical protein
MNMNPWELKTPDGSTIVINVRSVKRFPRSLAVHTVSRVLNNCGIATTIESRRGVAVGVISDELLVLYNLDGGWFAIWCEVQEALCSVASFHKHLDTCQQCKDEPFNLCAEGAELLAFAAAEKVKQGFVP